MLIYVRHMLSGPFSNWERQKQKSLGLCAFIDTLGRQVIARKNVRLLLFISYLFLPGHPKTRRHGVNEELRWYLQPR